MDIRPLFIIGTGRCGSTALHEIFATHRRLSYLSGLCDRDPERPGRNARLMRLLGLKPLEPLLRRRYYPDEVYRFWDHYAPGFSEPFRDLGKGDVTDRLRRQLPRALAAATSSSRPRLLAKITGWPRLGFLSELLPAARFIHVYRDGRAVANSTLNVWFWRGPRGPSQWRWGPLSSSEQDLWERHDRSFITLAGIQWEKLMAGYRRARAAVPPQQLLEISYEELCATPDATIRSAARFAGLDPVQPLLRRLRSLPLVNQNEKWRRDLTADQQGMLEESMRDELRRWGYD